MIGLTIDATEQFADLAKEEEARFFKMARAAVRKGATRLRRRIRLNLRGIGSGRVYMIGGHPHQASAPGEDPAKLTGELAKSLRVKTRTKKREGVVESAVFPGSRKQFTKAIALEFGAIRGNWILKPRSYMRRAQMQEEAKIGQDLAEVVRGP